MPHGLETYIYHGIYQNSDEWDANCQPQVWPPHGKWSRLAGSLFRWVSAKCILKFTRCASGLRWEVAEWPPKRHIWPGHGHGIIRWNWKLADVWKDQVVPEQYEWVHALSQMAPPISRNIGSLIVRLPSLGRNCMGPPVVKISGIYAVWIVWHKFPFLLSQKTSRQLVCLFCIAYRIGYLVRGTIMMDVYGVVASHCKWYQVEWDLTWNRVYTYSWNLTMVVIPTTNSRNRAYQERDMRQHAST